MTTRTTLDVLDQLADFFQREGSPELFPEILLFLEPEDLTELAGWPPESVERTARHYLVGAVREKGLVPGDEDAAAQCRVCGPVWVSSATAESCPKVDGWPVVDRCSWCYLTQHGFPIPRPSHVGAKPERGLIDPRAPSKLN